MKYKFSKKLFLIFSILISIPVIITASRGYFVATNIFEDKANQYSHDILTQVGKTLETRLSLIEEVSFNIIINKNLQDLLYHRSNSKQDEYEETLTKKKMEKELSSFILYREEISAAFIISNDGVKYGIDKVKEDYGLEDLEYKKINDKQGAAIWLGHNNYSNYIVLARVINSTRTQLPMATLILCIGEDQLSKILYETRSVEKGRINIIDQNHIIVSSSNKSVIGQKSVIEKIDDNTGDFKFLIRRIDGVNQLIAISEILNNGWRIVSTTPQREYLKDIIQFRNSSLVFILVLLILAFPISWAIASAASKPIRILSDNMEKFGKGELSVRCPPLPEDEIGALAGTFNNMADDLNDLVQRVVKIETLKREVEIQLLQMQINPHFIFNTLETINWLSRMKGNEDIGLIAKSLGDLLRASLYGEDLVALSVEKLNLESYLKIQNYRYGKKLKTEIFFSSKSEFLLIPKLLIQPIVENAILHGTDNSLHDVKITISSKIENDILKISVLDTGVGMTEKTVNKVLNSLPIEDISQSKSIGVSNVIKRIKTLFGDEFGVEIFSELGEGTEVILSLPVLHKKD